MFSVIFIDYLNFSNIPFLYFTKTPQTNIFVVDPKSKYQIYSYLYLLQNSSPTGMQIQRKDCERFISVSNFIYLNQNRLR